METTQLSLPVTPNQVINLVRQLPSEDKKRLLDILTEDAETATVYTHWASEQVLAKDWTTKTEEQAWQHL